MEPYSVNLGFFETLKLIHPLIHAHKQLNTILNLLKIYRSIVFSFHIAQKLQHQSMFMKQTQYPMLNDMNKNGQTTLNMFCNFPCWIWQQGRSSPSTASEFSCNREHSLKKARGPLVFMVTKCLNKQKERWTLFKFTCKL